VSKKRNMSEIIHCAVIVLLFIDSLHQFFTVINEGNHKVRKHEGDDNDK
jgi:hypothetical protein